jgi:hypothetical protein
LLVLAFGINSRERVVRCSFTFVANFSGPVDQVLRKQADIWMVRAVEIAIAIAIAMVMAAERYWWLE